MQSEVVLVVFLLNSRSLPCVLWRETVVCPALATNCSCKTCHEISEDLQQASNRGPRRGVLCGPVWWPNWFGCFRGTIVMSPWICTVTCTARKLAQHWHCSTSRGQKYLRLEEALRKQIWYSRKVFSARPSLWTSSSLITGRLPAQGENLEYSYVLQCVPGTGTSVVTSSLCFSGSFRPEFLGRLSWGWRKLLVKTIWSFWELQNLREAHWQI